MPSTEELTLGPPEEISMWTFIDTGYGISLRVSANGRFHRLCWPFRKLAGG